MDIAIIGNPYASASTIVNGTGSTIQASSRAAKMNEDKDHKVTNIRNRWAKEMLALASKKEEKPREQEPPKTDGVILVQKLELEPLEPRKEAVVGGFRKLKVNDLVRIKTLSFYNSVSKTALSDGEIHEDNTIPVTNNLGFEMDFDNSNIDAVDLQPVKDDNKVPHYMETPSFKKEMVNSTPVINTPARFATSTPEKAQPVKEEVEVREVPSPIPSRSNRKVNEYASLVENHPSKGIEVGQGERVLNKIASLNHSGTASSSNALENALLEFNKSEADKKASIDNLRRLEEEVESMQKALDKQRASQIADLKAKTEANKEETLEYTMHSEDLRQKLAELRSQLASGDSTIN